MAIILPGGFQITNNEAVDSRISVADQTARLGFSAANVYEGLLVYQQDTNEIYVLTNASDPASDSSWEIVYAVSGSSSSKSGSCSGSCQGDGGGVGRIVSSSYALTASYALNGSGNSLTSSYALTASYLEGFIESASYSTTSSHAITASYLEGFIESASFASTASHALTASYLDGFIESASFAATASYFAGFVESASYAVTASYVEMSDAYREDFTNVSSITVNHNRDTEDVLVAVYETTGGTSPQLIIPQSVTLTNDNTAVVTFATNVDGYVIVTDGKGVANTGFTLSSSYATYSKTSGTALSSSHSLYAISASYALSSSHEITHEVSSSYAQTATSASYALTASYALNGGGGSGFPSEYVTSNTTAEKGKTYVFETSTAYTLTLPSTPTDGDSIQISNRSNIGTNVLGRNGELIMGDANDLTLDLATASFILTYTGGNQGWVIIGAGGGATTGSAASLWYDGTDPIGKYVSSSVDVRITGSLSMQSGEANFETLQIVLPEISQSGNFADDTAAASGGIALGGLYRNGNLIAIRLS
jgi:hypothetical protein